MNHLHHLRQARGKLYILRRKMASTVLMFWYFRMWNAVVASMMEAALGDQAKWSCVVPTSDIAQAVTTGDPRVLKMHSLYICTIYRLIGNRQVGVLHSKAQMPQGRRGSLCLFQSNLLRKYPPSEERNHLFGTPGALFSFR